MNMKGLICGPLKLPDGKKIIAKSYADDSIWKSIDIEMHYPDSTFETICCIDYDEEKGLLRVLAFEPGGNDNPIFNFDYLKVNKVEEDSNG